MINPERHAVGVERIGEADRPDLKVCLSSVRRVSPRFQAICYLSARTPSIQRDILAWSRTGIGRGECHNTAANIDVPYMCVGKGPVSTRVDIKAIIEEDDGHQPSM